MISVKLARVSDDYDLVITMSLRVVHAAKSNLMRRAGAFQQMRSVTGSVDKRKCLTQIMCE